MGGAGLPLVANYSHAVRLRNPLFYMRKQKITTGVVILAMEVDAERQPETNHRQTK